jgi:2-amino-4-hydroxy-6-hydroxymethyldihydropteridine diphosphokinase
MIVYLSLGSNLGDRQKYLRLAVEALGRTPLVDVQRVSPLYETEPVGVKEQPDFLNAAAEIECRIPARELYDRIKEIETAIGRTRSQRWGPREIDIDIIYFGSLVLADGTVTVPHRERSNRRFVLQPIADLAPDYVDPVLGISVGELLAKCDDPARVVRIPDTLPLSLQEH